jgi:uncharacterized protein
MSLIESIDSEVREIFKTAKGCHDFDHTERVYNLCLKIGEKEGADLEILKLAALLHDIAREAEFKSGGKICHAEHGAKMAREILESYNCDADIIEQVFHCIDTHRFRGNKAPKSLEAKVLFDADKLDSIGAIGIGRAFVFAGETGSRVHNKNIDVNKAENYGINDTAYREFLLKLSKVKERLLTAESRAMAEERHRFMELFFDRINREVEGEI